MDVHLLNTSRHFTWNMGFPMVFRSIEYLVASSNALRARPTALAATYLGETKYGSVTAHILFA